ncbi:MAG: hypothetical protein ABIO67_05150, partial [Mycobacteriales bacterium]
MRHLRTVSVAAALGLITVAGAAAAGPRAATAPVRPGPAILYAATAVAPQLQSAGIWQAAPTLVSGTQAYRDGEWLYQDFLNDDHGAAGSKGENDPYGPSGHLYSPAGGTFVYPTDKVYANNAADLVELRAKPVRGGTAFRVTLNTLVDPQRSAFTLALGDGPKASWPNGAGVSSPSKVFATWHGTTTQVTDAATGKSLGGAETTVDTKRRQITVVVPAAVINPGRGTLRVGVGVGLWDPKAGGYLKPSLGDATATIPGGGTPQGVAIVNAGPRLNEPM